MEESNENANEGVNENVEVVNKKELTNDINVVENQVNIENTDVENNTGKSNLDEVNLNNNLNNKSKNKKSIIIVIILLLVMIGGVTVYLVDGTIKKQKYEDAIQLLNSKKYDDAYELFDELKDYELASGYRALIKGIEYLENENYQLAYNTFTNDVPSEINVYELKRYAQNGVYYMNHDYKSLYEENKYVSSYYNDKEKEMVYEGMYNYGLSLYNDGYYGSTKDIFTKIKDYKNSSEILKDKYFQLVDNIYSYSVSAGYTWGYIGLAFYSHVDGVIYTVFTQSLFDTNIPKGKDYSYKIKNNKLILGNNAIVYDILSFDGNKLVIKQGSSKFTLTKS